MDQNDDDDFKEHVLEHPNLKIDQLDPTNDPNDKVLFYERVIHVMIAKTIKGMLKVAVLATLNLDKKHLTWYDGDEEFEDGPIILKYLFLEINPSTIISMEKYKTLIETAKLLVYRNCDINILAKM